MLPLARELLKQGTHVVLAANELPSINDITAAELAALLPAIGQVDAVLGGAVASGELQVMSSGNANCVIDLSQVWLATRSCSAVFVGWEAPVFVGREAPVFVGWEAPVFVGWEAPHVGHHLSQSALEAAKARPKPPRPSSWLLFKGCATSTCCCSGGLHAEGDRAAPVVPAAAADIK
jgi:hypothetical protein